jgi:mannose-P-dolichol utilization defect protein 1
MDTLTSITRNLPAIIKDPAENLLGTHAFRILLTAGKHCYAVLVENLDLFHAECLKLGISKALGLGIVLAGSIVKLPQLLKLVSAKSGAGLSVSGYVLETIGYIITLAYNVRLRFPFTTYGETAFISIQNILILLLVLHFAKKDLLGLGGLGVAAALAYALFDPKLVSYHNLQILQGLSIPLSLTSKVPQIITNYRNGSTGQLSAFTVFNYLAGSAARVFTTLTEVNDPVIFWGFVVAAGLNAVLAAQMVYYWNTSPKTPATAVKPRAIKTTASTPKQKATAPRQKTPKTPTTPKSESTNSETKKTPKPQGTPSRKGRPRKKA